MLCMHPFLCAQSCKSILEQANTSMPTKCLSMNNNIFYLQCWCFQGRRSRTRLNWTVPSSKRCERVQKCTGLFWSFCICVCYLDCPCVCSKSKPADSMLKNESDSMLKNEASFLSIDSASFLSYSSSPFCLHSLSLTHTHSLSTSPWTHLPLFPSRARTLSLSPSLSLSLSFSTHKIIAHVVHATNTVDAHSH